MQKNALMPGQKVVIIDDLLATGGIYSQSFCYIFSFSEIPSELQTVTYIGKTHSELVIWLYLVHVTWEVWGLTFFYLKVFETLNEHVWMSKNIYFILMLRKSIFTKQIKTGDFFF